MSLLKWKELAQRKTELGNKINHVHDLITQHKIGQETSKDSLEKVFKPVTSKLDGLIDGDENLRMPQRRKRPPRKREVPNYAIYIDEVEDMNIGDMFGDDVPPQYEPLLEEIPKEPAPEYDYDEEVDYAIHDEDLTMDRLNELSLTKYQDLEEVYNDPEMSIKNKLIYFEMIRKKAEKERNKLKGSKSTVTKKLQ